MEVQAMVAPRPWDRVKLLGALVLVVSMVSSVAGDTRVVGGMDCEPHSQPWQVAILDMYKLYCGGVLVARQWVVTAAHCTTPGITTIRLGKHNLFTREWGEERKMVQKLVPHPNYNPSTKDNDIMLIKLLTPVTLTERIQPVPVASCPPVPGTSCTTSGWGATTSPEGTQCRQPLLDAWVPSWASGFSPWHFGPLLNSQVSSWTPGSSPGHPGPLLDIWVVPWTPGSSSGHLGPLLKNRNKTGQQRRNRKEITENQVKLK
uniref:Peptidase S1 domain-containing protein n=1 Tax=Anas platyrhynchos platyrhynchos TaxID=8840 RepID=A0A493U041_ANAPP